MKSNLSKRLAFAFIGSLFMAGSAMSTPIFTGEVVADFGIGDYENLTQAAIAGETGPGYYVWANNASRTSWSVRWTGGNWGNGTTENNGDIFATDYGVYDWQGSIVFSNPEGIDSDIDLVKWDSGDGTGVTVTDGLSYDRIDTSIATAGPHWDGFDFTLSGEYGDYLTFVFGSSYFTSTNDGVYIGQGLASVLDNADDLSLFRSGTGTGRQFEAAAPVPEPATMLLFGTGLLGLAGYRRKKTAKK